MRSTEVRPDKPARDPGEAGPRATLELVSPDAVASVSSVETPFGAFFIATLEDAIVATAGPRVAVSDPRAWGTWRFPERDVRLGSRLHTAIRRQVLDYFRGSRREFDVPLALAGREFDRLAWEAARYIPYGAAQTYGGLAMDVGAPGAARAVGRAMASCPAPLFIPCHRVIGAGGKRCGDPESWERREELRRFEVDQLAEAEHARNRRRMR